jgi:adenylate kinase
MLRERIAARDPLALRVVEAMNSGKFAPDDIVNEMVAERTGEPDCGEGFILDGYPRTVTQCESIRNRLTERGMGWVVVHLKVDYNEVIARLGGRRQCPRCGSLYNIHSSPPKSSGVCDRDSEPLVTRPDDEEAVIARRLKEYEAQTRPVLAALQGGASRVFEVNGAARTADALAEEISELVRK